MSEHTPGPWEIHEDYEILIQHKGGVVVDRIGTPVDGDEKANEEMRADVHLIAAAPDLLETCQHFFEWHADHFEDFHDNANAELLCLANECEQAISRATGKE